MSYAGLKLNNADARQAKPFRRRRSFNEFGASGTEMVKLICWPCDVVLVKHLHHKGDRLVYGGVPILLSGENRIGQCGSPPKKEYSRKFTNI